MWRRWLFICLLIVWIAKHIYGCTTIGLVLTTELIHCEWYIPTALLSYIFSGFAHYLNSFLHFQVLNAAMLYWPMPNVLYVEGYALDRFAEGLWALQPVHQNKVRENYCIWHLLFVQPLMWELVFLFIQLKQLFSLKPVLKTRLVWSLMLE